MFAKARKIGLVVVDLPDETLVYHEDNRRALCLNRSAAETWRAANGRRTIEEIAGVVGERLGVPVTEAAASEALGDLQRAGLLESAAPAPEFRHSRRRFVKNLLFAPAILSIIAPTVALAASCMASGKPCNPHLRCCSGVCLPGPGPGRCL